MGGMDVSTPLALLDDAATLALPFTLTIPSHQTAPLVFVSAHSGQTYPQTFLDSARLDARALRRSEDSFVDELFTAAPRLGAPLLAARFPRAFCDANREKWELDPAMFDGALPPWVNTTSARVGAGLGTIARVVGAGEAIYRGKLSFAEAQTRMEALWQPFHDALQALISATQARFGGCVVIDCHSMPAGSQSGRIAADVVLGDAHATACAPGVTRVAERTLRARGYAVRRNDPYAGGYITRHYGRPREGVHALQIELSRHLYMDEEQIARLPRFAATAADMTALIEALALEAAGLLAVA